MTHVGDRMAMVRFQNSRPYTWRSGGGCCCGGGTSIFNNYNMGPSFGYGGSSGLFKAGFITNMVFGCLDYAMSWTNQILGWCGFGGGTQTVTDNSEDAALKHLQQTFSDSSKYTVSKIDGKYVVTDKTNGKTYESTDYHEILRAAGMADGTDGTQGRRRTDNGGGTTPKTDAEKAQIKTDTDGKIAQAETDGKVALPAGAQKTTTVADDGKVTITVNYTINDQQLSKTATGDDAQKAVDELIKVCQQIQNDIAKAALAKAKEQDPNIKDTDGYRIETAGADKDGKTKAVFMLVKEGQETIYCNSIKELQDALGRIREAAAQRTQTQRAGGARREQSQGNKGPKEQAEQIINDALGREEDKLTLPDGYKKGDVTVAEDGTISVQLKNGDDDPNPVVITGTQDDIVANIRTKADEISRDKKIKDSGLDIRIDKDNIIFRFHGGKPVAVKYTPEMLDQIIQDETAYAASRK